jgi:general secretion pathway protein F
MAVFRYKAIGIDGKPLVGRVTADDQAAAITSLRTQALTLLEIDQESSFRIPLTFSMPSLRRDHLQHRELTFFARQLFNLLRAGSEIDRALDIILELMPRAEARERVRDLSRRLRSGKSLADALVAANAGFPQFFVSMVRAGEASGSLDSAFDRLAKIMERQAQSRSRMLSALIYPTILLLATIASIILIMTVVLPQFTPIFQQAGQKLPGFTRAVVGISDAIAYSLPFVVPLVIVLVGTILGLLRRPELRLKWDRRMLAVPLVGPFLLKSETGRLAHVMSALLIGGVPLANVFSIAQDSLRNTHMRAAVGNARELVRGGVRIAPALQRQGVFPKLFIQLTAIGEESARLGETLGEIGRIYDDETEVTMQRIVAVATPAATIVLGGMVASVLAAILLAVLKVNDLAI